MNIRDKALSAIDSAEGLGRQPTEVITVIDNLIDSLADFAEALNTLEDQVADLRHWKECAEEGLAERDAKIERANRIEGAMKTLLDANAKLGAEIVEAERERDEVQAWYEVSQSALSSQLEARSKLEAEVARITNERDEAVRKAWEEARELVRGTNADMCKDAGQAYRIIIEGLTNAIHRPELRTLSGRAQHYREDRTRMQELQDQLAAAQAEVALFKEQAAKEREAWLAEVDDAQDLITQLATLRSTIAEAVRRASSFDHTAPDSSYNAARFVTEPLRNLDQPEGEEKSGWWTHVPSPDPEQPDDPSQPEGEDALVEALRNASGFLDTPIMRRKLGDDWLYKPVVESIRKALASRGLVRGEGVER